MCLLFVILFAAVACDCGDDDPSTSSGQADDDNDDNDDDDTVEADIELIAGGSPGHNGTSLVLGESGDVYVAAVKGWWLYIYHYTEGKEVSEDLIALHASYPSLTKDSSGNLHVSYNDTEQDALAYSTNASGSWITETVEQVGWYGGHSSIAVDGSGNAYISYRKEGLLFVPVKFATNATDGWTSVTVDSVIFVWDYTTLALDGLGFAHMTYNGEDALWYAVFELED